MHSKFYKLFLSTSLLFAACFLTTCPAEAKSSSELKEELSAYQEELGEAEAEVDLVCDAVSETTDALADVLTDLSEQEEIVADCEDKLSLSSSFELQEDVTADCLLDVTPEPVFQTPSEEEDPEEMIKALKNSVSEWRNIYADTKDRLDDASDAVEELSDARDDLIEEAVDLNAQKADSESRKADLEEKVSQTEAEYNAAVKREKENASKSRGQTIVNAAYSQIGVPYVWGGSSPGHAFDCSGLVQYCLRQAGISVSHSSGSIGSGGTSVSNPQPGDVVCYSGHVAIYVGNGQMIEAPHAGASVRLTSVRSGCWYRRY